MSHFMQQKRAKKHWYPDKRFCDLDGAPLSARQLMIRATHGMPIKEIATGRIMRWSDMTGYLHNRGQWEVVSR